ncbi:hypothetical protein KCU78_g1489, partial [Aureobasidium melanogenum]
MEDDRAKMQRHSRRQLWKTKSNRTTADAGLLPSRRRACQLLQEEGKRISNRKTYSSRDSHVVTHHSTNLPFNCLCMAERTGCPVFS